MIANDRAVLSIPLAASLSYEHLFSSPCMGIWHLLVDSILAHSTENHRRFLPSAAVLARANLGMRSCGVRKRRDYTQQSGELRHGEIRQKVNKWKSRTKEVSRPNITNLVYPVPPAAMP